MQRAFATLPDRQVHLRQAGNAGQPLLMLHASPGSSKQLEKLCGALARSRRVIATDRAGNGDSEALLIAQPEIADYARAEFDVLDSLGIDVVDVYGSHTGAFVAMEMAIQAPGRVRLLVLDGIALFSAEQVTEFLARYAPPARADLAGTHLQWVFQFCRDQALFFPWFDPGRENVRNVGLPSAQALHDLVLEVLKSLQTYHLSYQAAFRYPARERLGLVQRPVLLTTAFDDPLACYLEEAARLVPHATMRLLGSLRAPDSVTLLAATICDFLDQ